MGPGLPPQNIPDSIKGMCHKLGQPKKMGLKIPHLSENYVEDVEKHHIGWVCLEGT